MPVTALIDSGASYSLVRDSFFEKIKKKDPSIELDVIRSRNYRLKSVTQEDVEICGMFNNNVQVTDDCTVNFDMLVIINIPFDVILGSNFLKRFDSITINFKNRQVILKKGTKEIVCRSARKSAASIRRRKEQDATKLAKRATKLRINPRN